MSIVLNKVFFSYDDERSILKNVNLNIEPGEFVALAGANGSGKSTLARLIAGLFVPAAGSVHVDEHDTRDEDSINHVRERVGMVFQNPENQIVATIVENDVAFAPENLAIPSDEIENRVKWALEVAGLTRKAQTAPHMLSGGQKQRLAVAGILAMHPKYVVLDEPTSMLDPSGRRDIIEVIRRMVREEGVAALLVTHFMEEIVEADRVIVLHEGNIVSSKTPLETFKDTSNLKKWRLIPPWSCQLSSTLRKNGFNLPENVMNPESLAMVLKSQIKSEEVDKVNNDEKQSQDNCFNESSDCKGNLVNKTLSVENSFSEEDTEENIETLNEIQNENDSKNEQWTVRIRELSHTYMRGTPFETEALKKVKIDIPSGGITAVIGATGSGKSTLIQHFNALLLPQTGKLRVLNYNLHKKKINLIGLRTRVGMVFQNPEDQLFEETVKGEIEFGPTNIGVEKEIIESRCHSVLNMVGLDPNVYLPRSPFALSGGEKRRVAIASILAMKPDVLVLDEPTSGLDPDGRELVENLITDLAKDISVFVVTHQLDMVCRIADRMIVLGDGVIKLKGCPEELFDRPDLLLNAGLSLPEQIQFARLLNDQIKLSAHTLMNIEKTSEALLEMRII